MFAGIIIRTGSRSTSNYATVDTLIRTLTPYHQADQSGAWENEKAILIHALTWNTGISKSETSPYQCPHSQLVITSWLRLDNRKQLAKALAIDDLEQYTDPMLVIAAYRRWGKDCINRLEGDFSFIIYDPQKHECFAARDAVGVKPFYYYLDGQVFIFASTASIFPKLGKFDLQPNEAWIAKFLMLNARSFTETGFERVLKLAPAHHLQVTAKNEQLQRYFEFKDDPPAIYQRDDKWVSAYREKLEQAVRDRVSSDYLIGSEISGGLDSSSVTALAALNLPHDKKHFHVFGYALEKNEPEYILETSQFHDIPHNHIYTHWNPEGNLEELVEREMRILGYPSESNIAIGHSMFYRLCKQLGIRTLLSGFGGDEVVTNTGHLLDLELLDAGRYKELYQLQRGNPLTRSLRMVRFLQKAYQRKTNYISTIEKSSRKRMANMIVRQDILQQHQILEQLETIYRYDADYRTINSFILGNRLAPILTARLESCMLVAASHQIEYRWPLLDRRLMQQYLSSPAIEKYARKSNRYLHRRAVSDILPAKIAWKPGKSMGKRPLTYQHGNLPFDRKWTELMHKPILLHPLLKSFIDQEKWEQQVSTPLYRHGDQNSMIISLNHQAVCSLNYWISRTFE